MFKLANDDQVKYIEDLLEQTNTDPGDALEDYGVDEVAELTSAQASELIDELKGLLR